MAALDLDALYAARPSGGPDWLAAARTEGWERFGRLGLPTPKLESWKYTNLAPLQKIALFAAPAGDDAAARPLVAEAARAFPDAHRVVLVNGRFAPGLSEIGALPVGARLGTLIGGVGLLPGLADDEGVARQFAGHAEGESRALVGLNAALATDGLVLRVRAGVAVERPIHLVSVTLAGDGAVSASRHLVHVEAGGSATLIEHHIGLHAGTAVANVVVDARVEAGATLHHYKIQAEAAGTIHLATTLVHLEEGAVYDNFALSHGARLARNEIAATIAAPEVECRLNGAYIIGGTQHCDTTTFIDHAAPRTASREVYKGVLDDTARGVFQGKIRVRQAAQKTDGYQLNRALLLSQGAEIDSKPELEIFADDVKCSHGATAGELSEDQLFYLRARGIDRDTARGLLIGAFVAEALEEVRVESVREGMMGIVSARLGRDLREAA
ncbi:MAG TPA: Fe-S cluster assembly protein SufD [Alphaproteobacteria bacterium]|nr:Fe-S cluster assembly protein SufD [Alphaproteobacteria bacterium]